MNVVVVNAGSVGKEGKLRVFMPYGAASRFEGGEGSAIFAVRGIRTFFFIVEPGQRVFRLPLQKHGTNLVLFDLVEFALRCRRIAVTSRDLSLNKYWIEFIKTVLAFPGDLQGLFRVVCRLLQIAGLKRKPRQSALYVVNLLFAFCVLFKLERPAKGIPGKFEPAGVHIDVTGIGQPRP